jgi:hypothetical protein
MVWDGCTVSELRSLRWQECQRGRQECLRHVNL